MKQILLIILCFMAIGLTASADDSTSAAINLQHKGHNDHLDQPVLADQPDVFLDTANAVIIIDGGGEVSYYDVEIESMTTWLTVISTQVSGSYDTIDISSLTAGDYFITITSPTGHEFEGEFTIN